MKKVISLLAAYFLLNVANATTISNAVTVEEPTVKIENKGLTLAPNAKTGDVQVVFTAAKAGNATVAVINAEGKTVLTKSVELTAGKNNINVDKFNELEEGNYTISLTTNAGNFSSPFLLWK